MRPIVLWMSVSLDGYFAGPNGEIDWHLVDDELHQYFNDRLATAGVFAEGRVTYELMAQFWPTADADPANPAVMREFARIWRDMPKIVYSRTLEHADWGTTIVREVVPEEVQALKSRPGGDIIIGGGQIAATFLRLGLVDELTIYVHPVVLGDGKALFPASAQPLPLRLIETRPFGNGVVLLRYAVG